MIMNINLINAQESLAKTFCLNNYQINFYETAKTCLDITEKSMEKSKIFVPKDFISK